MNEITKELLDALKMATLQNQLDMLMTGEELRKCESAIAKAEAILAAPQPSADGWIPWEGGERPVTHNTTVEVRLRSGWEGDLLASVWCWHHATQESSDVKGLDIIAYRVVKP